MNDKFQIIPQPILPSGGAPSERPKSGNKTGPAFEEVLKSQFGSSLRFSRHAQERMKNRGITFGPEEMNRVENAVNLAGAKGARDSLVFLDNTALVVSVRNGTVVTVVDQDSLRGNVFTNIDSAVIA